ncbi:hypothetical protein [Haloferax sp. Atlit-48N]|uniref:Uncharacterized protein n=1 Tax=Haloferax sp. Atlit-48N TaxID=2077198 RepID=A0ACD5HYW4_9EURY|nr:hypothetical protein [Haloferax sp. Atlit-48N]RDZ32495.1 hypothetical protein DEQ67_01650 [Haloferax sp. Atlit-48N]
MTPTTRRVTRDPRRLAHRFVRLATDRATVAVFAALAAVWAVGFVGVVPREIWVVDYPALVAAFFFDTLAANEFGVRETAVFYPALAVFGYLQAMVFVAAGRVLRTRLVGVGERRESGKRVESGERK